MTKLKKITDLKSILDRCEEVGECLERTGHIHMSDFDELEAA